MGHRLGLTITRRCREAVEIARALASTKHPLLAHLVITRRCNLSCAYCNEFDQTSQPVQAADVSKRIMHLARLGTSAVTLTGGEPLLHPNVCELVGQVRNAGMIAGMITNGFLLSPALIRGLNEAGLDHLQISIDNMSPNEISHKSLKTLDARLRWLAEAANFDVNVNSVVGAGMPNPEDAVAIAKRAVELGFAATVGVIHDSSGQAKPLNDRELQAWRSVRALGRRGYARLDEFQIPLVQGQPNRWRCRAGSRYLYICEDGRVHYCSQQRGMPGKPLSSYTTADLQTAYGTAKACAPHCTIGCVHRISALDSWRDPQPLAAAPAGRLYSIEE